MTVGAATLVCFATVDRPLHFEEVWVGSFPVRASLEPLVNSLPSTSIRHWPLRLGGVNSRRPATAALWVAHAPLVQWPVRPGGDATTHLTAEEPRKRLGEARFHLDAQRGD
jgi:hypothetical protein